ncbi:MAG: hypothetical protein ACI9H8_002046 [Lysobacterales bacterium]|jgi:hypothetical protein
MTTVTPMPRRLDATEADIRRIAKRSECVAFTKHASMRMNERGYTQTQVLSCIQVGNFVDGPTLDSDKQKGHKARMQHYCAGESIEVVLKLVEQDNELIIVITVI